MAQYARVLFPQREAQAAVHLGEDDLELADRVLAAGGRGRQRRGRRRGQVVGHGGRRGPHHGQDHLLGGGGRPEHLQGGVVAEARERDAVDGQEDVAGREAAALPGGLVREQALDAHQAVGGGVGAAAHRQAQAARAAPKRDVLGAL